MPKLYNCKIKSLEYLVALLILLTLQIKSRFLLY